MERKVKLGVVRVEYDEPVTALAAYFDATGRSKSDLEEQINYHRSVLFKAISGDRCSKGFGEEIEALTGLDKADVTWMERKTAWTFFVTNDKVRKLSEVEWEAARGFLEQISK